MIKRQAETKITELKSKYPVILITGPRQSGKTTLAKKLFPDHEYRNLENPDVRTLALNDPRKFLKIGTKKHLIIDEIQEVPELASYIQAEVDTQGIMAQYVITGSQNFQISQTVSQSLAGRVAQFELLPLTENEISQMETLDIDTLLVSGSYPGKYTRDIHTTDFYRDYINTYITRDVRTLKNIGDLSNFLRFMQLLAGRVGQLFNANEIANAVGVNYKTIQKWLSVLEASYIIFKLEPFYENFGKRLIKSPKIFFCDSGVLTYLLGINNATEIVTHPLYGNIFENFVISEKLKRTWNTRVNEKLFFWRDNNGVEIDLLVDKGVKKELIEIKSSQTFKSDMLKNMTLVESILQKNYKTKTILVYQGEFEEVTDNTKLINWRKFE